LRLSREEDYFKRWNEKLEDLGKNVFASKITNVREKSISFVNIECYNILEISDQIDDDARLREIHVQKKYFNEQHKNWRFFSKWMDRFSNRHKCNLIPTVYPRHVDGQPMIIIIYQKHLILYTFVCH
jgi:hypothetical protein